MDEAPDEAKQLVDAGVSLNCAPEALDRMQPWMADLTLLAVAEDARVEPAPRTGWRARSRLRRR